MYVCRYIYVYRCIFTHIHTCIHPYICMYESIQVYEFGLPTDKCYPYMAHNGPCQDPAGPQPLSPVPLGCV